MGQTQLKGNHSQEKYKGKLLHAKRKEKSLPREKSVLQALKGKYVKKLSNRTLPDAQISLISRGLKFIPVNKSINENKILRQLQRHFENFLRRMRLKYTFHGKNREVHPFYVKSDWNPLVQVSVALESYLEEVKSQLAKIKITKPKTTCHARNTKH